MTLSVGLRQGFLPSTSRPSEVGGGVQSALQLPCLAPRITGRRQRRWANRTTPHHSSLPRARTALAKTAIGPAPRSADRAHRKEARPAAWSARQLVGVHVFAERRGLRAITDLIDDHLEYRLVPRQFAVHVAPIGSGGGGVQRVLQLPCLAPSNTRTAPAPMGEPYHSPLRACGSFRKRKHRLGFLQVSQPPSSADARPPTPAPGRGSVRCASCRRRRRGRRRAPFAAARRSRVALPVRAGGQMRPDRQRGPAARAGTRGP